MKRHATDLVSLIFGLFFLLAAAWWYGAIFLDVDLNLPNLGWFLAGGLIVVGLIGVVASLRRDRQPAGDTAADLSTMTEAPTANVATAKAPTTEVSTSEASAAEPKAAESPMGVPAEREE